MGVINIFTNKPNKNIGIHIYKNKKLFKKIIPNKIRLGISAPHQIADPCLIERLGEIFCFYEEKSLNRNGIIKVVNLNNPSRQAEKVHLGTHAHVSFPFVFKNNDVFYMIPETNELNEVAIYECVSFPTHWKKRDVLLNGRFVDSSIIEHNGIFYLFTTEKVLYHGEYCYNMDVYFSSNLFVGYCKHQESPIQKGKKHGRLGGAVFSVEDDLFRLSQDCEEFYGSELNRFKINKLTMNEFKESMDIENLISTQYGLNLGGHHYSRLIEDNSSDLWEAIDVNYCDNYLQRFVHMIYSITN